MTTTTINVLRDFTRYPGGRFRDDGPWSGEALREDLVLPALRAFDRVTIEMDGPLGYGSSVLEECFGGLVREGAKAGCGARIYTSGWRS